MFYDYKLMNSSTLRAVWCHAHRQEVVSDNVGIPKICSKIEKLVEHNRLSLRSSALLLNGTARLYKKEADKLYQDCLTAQKMLYPHFQDASLADDNNTGSEERSRNSNNRDNSESARNHRFNSKNESEKSVTRNKDSTDYESSAMTSSTSDQSQVSDRKYAIDKIDAEVQTNKSCIRKIKNREKYKRKMTSDVNLPKDGTLVDEFNSPSKLICANINKKVKYL